MKRLLPLFFLLATPSLAQEVLTDTAYQQLETEILTLERPMSRLIEFAYRALDTAVGHGRYQQADSIIALISEHLSSTSKHPHIPVFWPALGEHVVLGILMGDPAS